MASKRGTRQRVDATTLETPNGPFQVAVTESAVVAAALGATRESFEIGLRARGHGPVRWASSDHGSSGFLGLASTTIEGALLGDAAAMAALERLPIDLDDRPAWDRAVLGAVRAIPRGEVRSYGEIARAVDRPGAARAVGGAVGRNPIGYVIPCHRVVAGDGTLGGYGGGWWGDRDRLLDIKDALLAAEGVALPRSRPPVRGAR